MADNNIIVFPLNRIEYDIIVDPDCEREIYDIVSKSGLLERFYSDYEYRIRLLAEYRDRAPIFHSKWFEKLTRPHKKSLYSLHMARINNLRILYSIGDRIILLCAFAEKQPATRKRQSYMQYTPIADARLKKYEEADTDE